MQLNLTEAILGLTTALLGSIMALLGWLLKKYADKTDRNELSGVKTAQLLDAIEKRMAERDKEMERYRSTLHVHGSNIQSILNLHHFKGCDAPTTNPKP